MFLNISYRNVSTSSFNSYIYIFVIFKSLFYYHRASLSLYNKNSFTSMFKKLIISKTYIVFYYALLFSHFGYPNNLI